MSWGLVALVALLLSGCVKAAVEDGLRQALQERLGTADRYEVTVSDTSNDDLNRGLIHHLHVEASRVAREGTPVVDQLTANMVDLLGDPATRTFKSAATADISLSFREQDLL